MTKQNTLHNFTQEQHALNNISDMLTYIFNEDPILEDMTTFSELTKRTLELMKHTDNYEHSLKEDKEFLDAITNTGDTTVDEVLEDITYVLLHATIARQSLVIDKLATMLGGLPEED